MFHVEIITHWHVAKEREDDETSEETCEAIDNDSYKAISDTHTDRQTQTHNYGSY